MTQTYSVGRENIIAVSRLYGHKGLKLGFYELCGISLYLLNEPIYVAMPLSHTEVQ